MRLVLALVAVVVAVVLVVATWNDARAADVVSMRIFLVGWGVAAAVFVSFSFVDGAFGDGRSASRSAALAAVLHMTAGLLIGLAVGTTDWISLQLNGWWQLWLTVPLLLLYVALLANLRTTSRTDDRR